MNEQLIKLTKYVNAAADLAEGVERDIKNGKKISPDTVHRLAKFVTTAKNAASMWDELVDTDVKLQ